jgi:hypothetical protein
MIDQQYDRDFQLSRVAMYSTFATAASHLLRLTLQSFKVLNRIEYSSPWTMKARRGSCH